MSLGGIIGQAPDLNEYLPKSGGTMTGPLVLSGNPSGNLEAASKQYVDSKASEWKEIEFLNQYADKANKGNYNLNFEFSNLLNYYELKLVLEWRIRVQSINPSHQMSSVNFGGLTGSVNVSVGGEMVEGESLQKIVLPNFKDQINSNGNLITRKFFNISYEDNSFSRFVFSVNSEGKSSLIIPYSISSYNLYKNYSRCFLTLYGKTRL